MRRSLSLALMSLVLACRPSPGTEQPQRTSTPDAAEPTPAPEPTGMDALPVYIQRLADDSTRTQALIDLELLILARPDRADRDTITEALVPALVELWAEAPAERRRMLSLCLLLEHPATAPVWGRAVGLDGTAAAYDLTLRALEGIEKSRARGAVPSVIAALEHLIARPKLDLNEPRGGEVRFAMVKVLGQLGDRQAVPVLTRLLEQTVEFQPIAVHRQAVDALGRIADPSAVEPMLTAMYSVPDVPTSKSLPERVKVALASIGEPAVAPVVKMLRGENPRVQALLERHGLHPTHVGMSAAMMLGTIGSASAVDPLLEFMPTKDCGGRRARGAANPDDTAQIEQGAVRAAFANALGLIGDDRAVGPLCRCATASRNPGDMFPIAEALGRIGGERATACLARVITKGRYDPDAVASPEFQHEIRWEAARFGILAADPERLPTIAKAIKRASRERAVAERMTRWESGRAVLFDCKKDLTCFSATLADPNADAFAREVAAVNAARLAPGDAAVAAEIAAAYAVRDPDARVTMAWLVGHMMQGKPCPACADALDHVMEQEKASRLDARFQLSVLMARYAIAKLREPNR